jgi:hypothetical protein
MNLDLMDTEAPALAGLLRRVISNDRYPLSLRVKTWQAILDKVAPRPVREPPPALPKAYAPLSRGLGLSRRQQGFESPWGHQRNQSAK